MRVCAKMDALQAKISTISFELHGKARLYFGATHHSTLHSSTCGFVVFFLFVAPTHLNPPVEHTRHMPTLKGGMHMRRKLLAKVTAQLQTEHVACPVSDEICTGNCLENKPPGLRRTLP